MQPYRIWRTYKKDVRKVTGKGHIYALDVDPIESVKTEKRLHDAGLEKIS